ncbi:MAG TPA: mechanosensitive ion channel [Devosia sp.]|nr:mechanosensitive ion channel [Devosia sp.]
MNLENIVRAPYYWLLENWTALLFAVLALVIGWYVAALVHRLIGRMLPQSYGVSRNFAPLLAQASRYGIIIFAIVTALSFLGISTTTLYGALAAAGLAIALALQNTLTNIAAGIMLIWLRPIAVGEYIVGDGVAGVVVEIGLFGTRLRSTSGLYIFTPNLKLWNSAITNHSREPRRRIEVSLTIPDTINVATVRKLLLKTTSADKRIYPDPPADVHVASFTGDTVTLRLRAWAPTPQYLNVLRDVTEKSKAGMKRLLAEGETAEIATSADPHTTHPHEQTPDL